MARSITTRSTNPKIMDDNIKILDDNLSKASAPDAEDVVYDNTDSGLTATDVQEAIDEVARIGDNEFLLTRQASSVESTYENFTLAQGTKISDFKNIIFVFHQYSNVLDSVVIPVSYFKTLNNSGARILWSEGNSNVQIYYVDDTTVAIYSTRLSPYSVSIIGIR